MTTLSICLIIKNEENCLQRCLSSIKAIADEIIVVDTGSTDDSIQIAFDFGAQVFFYEWANDFSSARNYSLDKASGEWILIIDADEELDGKSLELLKGRIRTPDAEAYLLTVSPSFKKQHDSLDASFSLQLRLFKNNANYRYQGIIYERVLDSILEHNPSFIKTASDIVIVHYGCNQEDTGAQYRLSRNVDLIEQVLNEEREEPLKHFLLGREYYRHYRFTEALAHFRMSYEGHDKQADYIPELLRFIITSLYKLGKTSEALAFLDDVFMIRTGSADLYYLKGIIHQDLGHYSIAMQSFKEVLSHYPQSPYREIIYYQSKYTCLYYLGVLSEYFMDLDGALVYYFESLKNNPYLITSFHRMIAILNPRKNPDYTVVSLNRVFDLSDRNIQAELASVFYQEGAYRLVLDCINQLESSGQIPEKTKLLKGISLMRVKKDSESVEILHKITQDTQLYIEARQYLLFYHWIIKESPLAFVYLRQIKNAGADPSTVYVLNLLTRSPVNKTGIIQERAYRLAKEFLALSVELGEGKQVITTFNNLSPLLGVRPSMLLAETYYKCEKYELARGEFFSLLKKGYDYPLTYYYLGRTCWALGDLASALQYLKQAISGGLDTPRIRREKERLDQELALEALKEKLNHFPDEIGLIQQIKKFEEDLMEI